MAGTSNLGSWVSTHTASRGPSVGADPLEQPVGPVDDDLVGQREAALGGEHLAGVAHRDPVAEHLGHPDQRGGEVDGAEDQHAGRRGERLDEDGHVVLVGLAAARRSGAPPSVPASSSARASRPTTRSRSGSPSEPSGSRSGPTSSLAPTPGPSTTVARATGCSARSATSSSSKTLAHGDASPVERLDEEVDRAAAGEADGEGLVVAVAEGDDASRRSPVCRMSSASVTTAPSTQPPDTEPATSPSSLTAMAAPGIARARSPRRRRRGPARPACPASASGRGRRGSPSSAAPPAHRRASSGHHPASCSREASEWPSTNSSTCGQGRRHPPGERGVAGRGLERVHPHHPVGHPVQPGHLLGRARRGRRGPTRRRGSRRRRRGPCPARPTRR